MRNLKKVLVMVLALAMMLSIMVVGAGAVPEALTDFNEIDDAHKEAVEMATQLNIIEGFPDKSFQPKGDVTRAQIAKMICIAINGGEVPATSVKATPSFSDIKGHWAEGFIEYCYAKGIIDGYPSGKFEPEGKVTGAEAAKMMLTALGYNSEVEKFVGDDWDLYVNVKANQDGLYVDLKDIQTTEKLSREHTAQMVWNMLQAYTITQSSSIDRATGTVSLNYVKSDDTMFWESYRGIYDTKAVLVGYESDDGESFTYYFQSNHPYYTRDEFSNVQAPAKNAVVSVDIDADYTAWLGQKVAIAFNADDRNATFKANAGDAYGIFHKTGSVKETACFGDLGKLKADDDTITINGTPYRMDDVTVGNLKVYYATNGDSGLGSTDYKLKPVANSLFDVAGTYTAATVPAGYNVGDAITKYDHLKFNAIDQDGNDKIDLLLVVPYEVAQVTAVNGSKISLNIVVDDQGNVNNTKKFLEDVNAYDGIQRDDWVIYTPAQYTVDDKATLVKADLISGEITGANDRTTKDTALATIDGTQYTFSYYFDQTMGNASDLCKVGNRLDNAVVVNNFIFAVDFVKKAAITDFALVTNLWHDNDRNTDKATLLFYNSKADTTEVTLDATVQKDTSGNYITNNGRIEAGTLVTYSRNSDGDYILKKVSAGSNDYVVDWTVTGASDLSNSKTTAGYLASNGKTATINDDAVIFVRYLKNGDVAPNYSYKVITGSQLKLNESGDITATGNAQINSLILGSRYNNVNHVELAYVDIAPRLEDSDTLYAYVLDGSNGLETSTTRGDTVRGVDLWTADGFQHLQFAGSIEVTDANGNAIGGPKYQAVDAGVVIKYKVNEAGDISEILGVYDIDRLTDKYGNVVPSVVRGNVTAATDAISSFDPLTFQDNGNGSNGKYWDLDDATILYVDNDAQEGATADGRSLMRADKKGGALVDNVFVIYNNQKGTVNLIVMDINNDIDAN